MGEAAIEVFEHYLDLVNNKAVGSNAQAAVAREKACLRRKTATVHHWLSALRGEASATAPAEYVAKLFDGYADRFDEHLVEKLHYQTPSVLMEAISETVAKLGIGGCSGSGAPLPFKRCADLGCGTGLMGPLLVIVVFKISRASIFLRACWPRPQAVATHV